jgi:CHRD domain-containing protein
MRKLIVFGIALGLLTLAGTALAKEFKTGGLNGGEEVPARDTNARGNAMFEVSDDGLSMSYKLIVANIDNVIQAHIHIGPPGVNGPVVLFLHELVPPGGGPVNGLVRQGTVTAANLVGPLAGHPLSDLIAAMSAGNAYVNVHTNDGVGAINTGPGDFPGGEIRGQIRE